MDAEVGGWLMELTEEASIQLHLMLVTGHGWRDLSIDFDVIWRLDVVRLGLELGLRGGPSASYGSSDGVERLSRDRKRFLPAFNQVSFSGHVNLRGPLA